MVQRTKITAIKGVADLRKKSFASCRRETHHAGECIRAVEDAVGSAQNLSLIDGCSEDVAKIHRAADLSDGNSMQPDGIRVAAASADETRLSDAALPRFEHLH